jgi:signal transduction histidine kinase
VHRKPLLLDIAMIVLVAVLFAVSGMWSSGQSVLLGVVQLGPLAFRRRAPGWVLGVVTAATVAQLLVGPPHNIAYLPVLISLYLAPSSRHRFVRTWLCALAGAAIALATVPGKGPIDGAVLAAAVAGVAWMLGVERQRHVAERSEFAARRAWLRFVHRTGERRERTARRLHDTLAQTTTVMLIQGEALRTSGDTDRTRLDTMLTAGRDTLAQVRRTLRELHNDDDPGSEADVIDVLAQLSAAGLVLESEPRLAEIPWPVRKIADRVIAEAATNALRHNGPGVRLSLDIEVMPDVVRITARNNRAAAPAWRAGFGLTSLREQLEAQGGSLEFGPAGDRHWVVVAAISLDTQATPTR